GRTEKFLRVVVVTDLVRHERLLLESISMKGIFDGWAGHELGNGVVTLCVGLRAEAEGAVVVEAANTQSEARAVFESPTGEEVDKAGRSRRMRGAATHRRRLVRHRDGLREHLAPCRGIGSTRSPDLEAVDAHARLKPVGAAVEVVAAIGVGVVRVGVG